MEEINISEFLTFIKKHIVFLVSMAFIVLIIGILYFVVLKKPIYSSDVSLTLTGVSSEQGKITTNDITLNTKMLPTYQEVITSRQVLEQVNNNLHLNRSISELSGNIKIQAATDSMVLNITVTDTDRVAARDIANEIASIFGEEIQTLYNINSVTILDRAIVSDRPTNINYAKSLVISFAIGLLVSFASLFIVFYLDTTVKGVEQVTTKLGMIVLGGVPIQNSIAKGRKKGGNRV